ncbi:MAG: hypothetical protein Fur0037_24540 [Planctomycetota bacterium]
MIPPDGRLPPDLVVFDVDGTLHDTFRWWGPVLREGLIEFGARLGFEPVLPDDEEAASVVGLRDEGVWAPFLPPEHRHRWREFRKVVVPLELAIVRGGRDFLFPGVRDLLRRLRELGVKVALASNCRSAYMGAMMDGQGLADLSDWQFCLDSPGVENKTDMLRQARARACAARPVMVGDREADRDPARILGWPFVWRRNARCAIRDAEIVWDGSAEELLGKLGVSGIS